MTKSNLKCNIPLRVALVLLCLVVLTFPLVANMLARYKSSDIADNGSQVAKFGVKANFEGELFENGLSIQPGIGSTENGGMIISLEGKPEVAVKATATLNLDGVYEQNHYSGELCLPRGYYHINYGDKTVEYLETEDAHENFNDNHRFCLYVENDYYPLQYTVQHRNTESDSWSLVEDMENISALQLKAWYENTFNRTFSANQDLADLGDYKITWNWPRSDVDETVSSNVLMLMWATKGNGTDYNLSLINSQLPENISLEQDITFDIDIEQIN